MNMGIDKRLCITVMEAAKQDIMRNLMYALTKQGKLCVIEFGRRLLVPRAALDRMLGKGVKR